MVVGFIEWMVARLVWSRHLSQRRFLVCIFCVKNDVKNKMYMDVSVREVRICAHLNIRDRGQTGTDAGW